jgi:hypothetical protein
VEQCAEHAARLLADAELRGRLGEAGRLRVRDRFLTLRELEDYLRLMTKVA